jgi:transcriptional regulator with XRE-family HTH domain
MKINYKIIDKNINYIIKNKREKLNFSQNYVCKNAKISKSFLSEIENNKKSISFKTFIKLNNVLNLLEDLIIKE